MSILNKVADIFRGEPDDVLELPNNLHAVRANKTMYVIDNDSNKVKFKVADNFSSNPSRAAFQVIKKFNIIGMVKKKAVWTCGFRPVQDRWVWYVNSEPKITVSFVETNDKIEKQSFFSSSFGTLVINDIKKYGVEIAASNINASVLERPYMKIKCGSCNSLDNYTIDDILDENRNLDYDSKFVACSNCNTLVNLT